MPSEAEEDEEEDERILVDAAESSDDDYSSSSSSGTIKHPHLETPPDSHALLTYFIPHITFVIFTHYFQETTRVELSSMRSKIL